MDTRGMRLLRGEEGLWPLYRKLGLKLKFIVLYCSAPIGKIVARKLKRAHQNQIRCIVYQDNEVIIRAARTGHVDGSETFLAKMSRSRIFYKNAITGGLLAGLANSTFD